MSEQRHKTQLGTRTALGAGLLIALVLVLQYLAGWLTVQMTRMAKENDLAAHLADLGRLAPALLREPALGLVDLALDATLEAPEGTSSPAAENAPAPDPAAYHRGLERELTEPFTQFAADARLARVVLLSEQGRVLYDTAAPARLLVPYDFWEVDRFEIRQALAGAAVASPAYTAGDGAYKRYYLPLREGQAGAPVRAVLCLAAGRTYLAGLDRLAGHVRQLNLILTVLMGLIGALVYHLIRRQRRIERQAAEADRLAGLGTLAAGFAHELRNPLGIIRAFTEDLERSLRGGGEHGPAREEAMEACRDIVEEVERMNRLVGQFLSYSRGQAEGGAGGAAPALETTESVLTMLRPSAETRQVALALELAAGEGKSLPGAEQARRWRVGLDAGAFKQVLINLILNAVQSSPAGGRVTLMLRAGARQVELQVQDEGPGVAERDRQRIFEPFYSTRPAGAGLGLAVSRQLVTGVGGALALAPAREGRGACFVLMLPRAEDREPAPKAGSGRARD